MPAHGENLSPDFCVWLLLGGLSLFSLYSYRAVHGPCNAYQESTWASPHHGASLKPAACIYCAKTLSLPFIDADVVTRRVTLSVKACYHQFFVIAIFSRSRGGHESSAVASTENESASDYTPFLTHSHTVLHILQYNILLCMPSGKSAVVLTSCSLRRVTRKGISCSFTELVTSRFYTRPFDDGLLAMMTATSRRNWCIWPGNLIGTIQTIIPI